MIKYEIPLPNNKSIKYRVTKESSDWVLIEAIIDNSILELLNSFATATEVEDKKAPAEAPEPAPVKPAEPDPEIEKKTEKKNQEAELRIANFSPNQKAEMKHIKEEMKMKSNDELDPFISEWSALQGKSWHYLNADNIDDFIRHMKENYLS